MAVTCGFFNALEHDRLYDAIQMSSIFDGIIRDGIFSTIGTSMAVTASGSGLVVNVGAGRAWFNHTWILNDTLYPVEAEAAEVVLDRIDALVIEVNQSAEVRDCSIKFVKGTPSSRPVRPTLTHNAEVNQYALAYISIRAGQTTIFQADITSVIGNDETPFVTGLLQQTSIESIVAQWQDEFYTYFNNFRSTTTSDFNTWMAARVAEYNAWYASMEAEGQADLAEFDSWFQEMKDQLSEDAAGHLQAEIDALELSAEKGSVVIVTTSDDTLINHACTISQGSSERNATFDINRTATFESVPFIGDMHITSTNGTLIANKDINIPYFGRYNYDLEFWEATLAISSSSTELYERPITITKGGTTVGTTSFDNTGHATFKVHEPGTYTVTSTTTGGVTFTANVVVTEETSYPVDLGTPIGKTALPTDDIQLWLKCGSEYDCEYTTLAEVLADPELFARLCADSNACDYMARSTTWAEAEGLVPAMTDNTHPSGVVSANAEDTNTPAYKAFNNDDSDYWSNGAATGWIQYEFPSAKCIKYAKIIPLYISSHLRCKNFTISASNDGTNWNTLYTGVTEDKSYNSSPFYAEFNDNETAYTHYRMSITSTWASNLAICTLQFFEDADITTDSTAMQIVGMFDYCANALIDNEVWCEALARSEYYESVFDISVPKMTSNTAPSGTVSSSTANNSHPAWHAFDKNDSTQASLSTPSYTSWIQYDFGYKKNIKAFSYLITGKPKSIGLEIKYSDNNSTFYSAGTYRYEDVDINNHKAFKLNDEYGEHRYWRLIRTLDDHSVNWYGIANTIQFYGRTKTAEDIITIHSAANDTIYYMDGQTPVTVATTDANGRAVINAEDLGVNDIVLYSTVAKNPDNLSNAYSKSIKITKYTTEIYLMPILALYWWGYKSDDLENCSTENGWGSSRSWGAPTYNQNNITTSGISDSKDSGVGKSKFGTLSVAHTICKSSNVASGFGLRLEINVSKSRAGASYLDQTVINSIQHLKKEITQGSYVINVHGNNGRNGTIYALWYE